MYSAGLIKAGMFETRDGDARRLVKRLNHRANRHTGENRTVEKTRLPGDRTYKRDRDAEGWKR